MSMAKDDKGNAAKGGLQWPTTPGKFAAIGPLAFGTHRDGRRGVMSVSSGLFIPLPKGFADGNGKINNGGGGDGGGNNLNNRPDEDEQGLDKGQTSRGPRVPRGASWKQIVGAYFPRTREPRKKIGETTTMKRGGLVRGCGVAQRGRGKGKMV